MTKKIAKALVAKFESVGVEIDEQEIIDEIEAKASDYRIPVKQASIFVEKELISKHGIRQQAFDNGNQGGKCKDALIEDITEADRWVNVTAMVDDLWEVYDDSISQIGILKDKSGRMKFTTWKIADQPEVVPGEMYHFSNIVSKHYDGDIELKITKKSSIRRIEDADTPTEKGTAEFAGTLTDIQYSSGLIERCEDGECSQVLYEGECAVHGDVDGTDDLRIKAVVDNGIEYREVTFGTEATEDIVGMSLNEAASTEEDELSEIIHSALVGEYVELDLVEYDTNSDVKSYEVNPPIDVDRVDPLLIRGRETRYMV